MSIIEAYKKGEGQLTSGYVHCSKMSLLKLTISEGQGGGVRKNKVEFLHH